MSNGDETATDLPLADAPPPPQAGFDLEIAEAQRYQLISEFAKGGVGRIILARDKRLGRDVAVKELLHADRGADRFVREAALTAQLQHPSIVPVYDAARRAGAGLFYVMKLVEGRTLRDAIAGATTLRDRLALLPHVIAVSEAIAYAHSKRVVHRDLKPHNVLVGTFGETTVIDWGLAKEMDREEAPGGVVGTPAYMPPEQARGDAVDERTDVYALGAMLYHLLTGKMPYAEADSASVLQRVLEGPPAPIAERVEGVPPELAAIAAKAMARAADDRYASARELADDLKRFQTGMLVSAHDYSTMALFLRWLRRYRAVVTASAIAIVALAVVGVFSVRRVIRERDRFETQRAAAEDLVQFMLFDLRDRLTAVGKLDLLDAVAGEARTYYAGVEASLGELDDRALDGRAQAFAVLAEVRVSQGALDEAAEIAREALTIRRVLGVMHPNRTQEREATVDSVMSLATIENSRGKYDSATRLFDEANQEVDHLREGAPDDMKVRFLSGKAVGRRGATEDDSQSATLAIADYGRAAELLEALLRDTPDDRAVARELATTERRHGYALAVSGDAAVGLAHLRRAEQLWHDLLAKDPENRPDQRSLADTENALGVAERRLSHLDAALRAHAAGVAIERGLIARDPTNLRWQNDLANQLSSSSRVHELAGQKVEALADATEALLILDRLVVADPRSHAFQQLRMSNLNQLGEVEQDDHPALALPFYRSAYEANVALLADAPNTSKLVRAGSHFRLRIGECLLSLGRADEALVEFIGSRELADKLLALEGRDSDAAVFLAGAHTTTAEAYFALSRLDEGVAEVHAAIALTEDILARKPSGELRFNLAQEHVTLGEALESRPERAAEARENLERARSILDDMKQRKELLPNKQFLVGEVDRLLAKLPK